ncbi:MAG: MFS transporter [Microcoleaceae cyanobacterium]
MAQLREVSARASAPQLNQRLSPMRTFVTVWLGQIVSVLGSYITDFALGVWVLQTTGSITNFALALVFMHLPSLIIAPFAGALVDRWNRRWAMLLSDVVKCSTALTMMFLVSSDSLQVWHIYVGVAVGSACVAFQWPAYISAITQLVPKQHLSRANGMVQISKALARFVGLAVAGGLMEAIQVRGVLLLDSFSYLFAIFMLLIVRFPATEVAQRSTNVASLKKLWQETTAGWQYIAKYPG